MVCKAVDDLGRKHDRVLRLVRISAVSAHAADGDIDRIDIRVGVSFRHSDMADLNFRVDREIRSRNRVSPNRV